MDDPFQLARLTGDVEWDLLYGVVLPGSALLATFALWRLRRRLFFVFAIVAGIAAAYLAALVFVATDFRDAGQWPDCWPSCSAVQGFTGLAIVVGGGVLLLSTLLSLVPLAVLAIRRRRDGPTRS